MITWWSVTIDDGRTTFGFGSRNGVICTKFPDNRLLSANLANSTVRAWFLKEKAQVVKICDQYEPSDISKDKQLETNKVSGV